MALFGSIEIGLLQEPVRESQLLEHHLMQLEGHSTSLLMHTAEMAPMMSIHGLIKVSIVLIYGELKTMQAPAEMHRKITPCRRLIWGQMLQQPIQVV